MAKIDLIALAAAKKYTKDTADRLGSLKGAPCEIKSKTPIEGGTRIIFSWTGKSGQEQTEYIDVMNGADGQDGEDGKGIKAVSVNAQNHLIITYDDDTTYDAGTIEIHSAVDSVNGKTGEVTLTASDVGALPDDTTIPSKTSDLDNDSNFVVDANYVHTDNNYDATAKGIVDGVTAALADKVDKVQGKGLSTNDYTDADKAEVAKVADKADAEDVIDGASYDSTNHLILFKNGTTTLFSLDAAAFVKDGMVDTVTITGGNLVITFNTDAGKQAISIPLTDIFDPANYYDKDDVDGLLADKADKVASATNGNFAGLDANGNLTDSGKKAGDFATPADIAGQQSLLKDTVGWTGKNELKNDGTSQTKNGITYSVDADKRVKLNGTSTTYTEYVINSDLSSFRNKGKRMLTGGRSGDSYENAYLRITNLNGENTAYQNGVPMSVTSDNGVVVDFDAPFTTYGGASLDLSDLRIAISVTTGATVTDKVFSPMLRRADILDDTYEPYHESVETMYEEEIHGVNLLKITAVSKTENDITFTVNAGGSITVNGTATANTYLRIGSILDKVDSSKKYILSGCPSNGSLSSYFQYVSYQPGNGNLGNDIGNGITFQPSVSGVTFTSLAIYIYIKSGQTVNNLVFKPMIRKAEIEDSTYRPYNHQAIQNQLNAQGVLGAKNLLKNTATSQTINGITFAVNADGSVTANGTATAVANFNISLSISDKLSCILNGCPSGGSDNSYRIGARYNNSGTLTYNYDTGSGCGINDISIVDRVFVQIANGQTVNNLVFRPMLRLASDPDDTYVPYAPTNAKLNEEKMSYADNGVLGAKNLLPYPFYQTTRTTNGITFTDNGDGTITANGTATADAIFHCLTHITGTTFYQSLAGKAVILSGCPAGGANNKYYFGIYDTSAHNDVGEGLTYQVLDTPPSSFYIQIVIRSGITVNNLIFKPMLRLASDPDDTYVPYAPTNRECMSYRTNGVLGAKNLIPFPYKESSTTKSGTTYTVNSDGSITLSTDAQGATAQSYITLADQGVPGLREKLLLCKQLTLSGGKSASIWLNINNPGALGNNKDSGKGVTVPFTNTSNLFNIALVVERGTIITTPVTVYPLLRLASDPDDTYQPYAMTNRELTEKVIIKDVSGYSWDSAIDGNKEVIVKRYGAIVSIYGYFRSTNALAQYANVLSGLPHCASGAALSGDALRSMGMTLSNVDSATSKITVNSATTANLQYTFNFVYLTDAN